LLCNPDGVPDPDSPPQALAVAVDESCMASPRTGSAPPSEAKVKFERYTPDGGGSIKKQRALPPQKRYQRFSEQEWKTNIIGTMTSAAFLGNFCWLSSSSAVTVVPGPESVVCIPLPDASC